MRRPKRSASSPITGATKTPGIGIDATKMPAELSGSPNSASTSGIAGRQQRVAHDADQL